MLAVERVRLAEPELVYNFTVKGPHTYFVLEVGVLVHNASCGPSGYGLLERYKRNQWGQAGYDVNNPAIQRFIEKGYYPKDVPTNLAKNLEASATGRDASGFRQWAENIEGPTSRRLKTQKVIELGPGTGIDLPLIAKHYPNAKVIGIDSWQGGYAFFETLAQRNLSQIDPNLANRIILKKANYLDPLPEVGLADMVFNVGPGSQVGDVKDAVRGAARLVDAQGQIYLATDLSIHKADEIVDVLLTELKDRGIQVSRNQIKTRPRTLDSWRRGNNYLELPLDTEFESGSMWELFLDLGQTGRR